MNTKTHNNTIISQCTRVEISWLNATYNKSQISLQNQLNLIQKVNFLIRPRWPSKHNEICRSTESPDLGDAMLSMNGNERNEH